MILLNTVNSNTRKYMFRNTKGQMYRQGPMNTRRNEYTEPI